ncbi:MAG: hypothetical protein JWL72_4258 [Ilumatobacteraceae bacterium]|nr:hypothetical protein [Ilumatobacteraceae bacterium]
MTRKLSRLALVGAALAASTAVALSTGGTSAFAAPAGGATLTPASGTSATTTVGLAPAPTSGTANCTGGGGAGYHVQPYFISRNADAATLTYTASGPTGAGSFVEPFYDPAGSVIITNPPSDGLVDSLSGSFSSQAGDSALVAGQYKVGLACYSGSGTIDAGHYWETPVTISNVTATSFSYASGWTPDAPVVTPNPLTPGNGTLSGTFSDAVSTPAQTSYTITAVPTAGATVVIHPAAPGAFSLTGLTNGIVYTVTATATNAAGTSSASVAVTGTPAVVVPAPNPFTATSGVGQVVLNWTPAAVPGGYTLVNHVVTVTPTVAGAPFTVPAGTNTLTVPASTVGTYSFSIQATYSPGTGVTAGTATATADSLPSQVILQDITVNRPVGALVLTQRCGVNGQLPAVAADPTNGFGALALLPASANQTGTAPTIGSLAGPAVSAGEFGQYPYPVEANGVPNPTYSTHCGINLGVGSLITSGPRAGQYFTATGYINEVTVVDTRDTDPGFTINGNASPFTNGTSTFSGNYLGWQPVVTSSSGTTLAGYTQAVTAGPILQPALATGLATNKALASAPVGNATSGGLGIATLDARLKLLIPLTARNGNFTSTLTFTTA